MGYKKFIRLWCENKTNAGIARAFDRSGAWVYQTAKKLEQGGVHLPQRSYAHKSNIDAEHLNAYISKLIS